LTVCPGFAHGKVFGVLGLNRDLKRDYAKDGVVDMVPHWDAGCFGSAGSKGFELVDQLRAQSVVMGERGKGQSAVPCGHLRVVDGRAVLVGTGDKVFGNPLANFLWRQARGPVC